MSGDNTLKLLKEYTIIGYYPEQNQPFCHHTEAVSGQQAIRETVVNLQLEDTDLRIVEVLDSDGSSTGEIDEVIDASVFLQEMYDPYEFTTEEAVAYEANPNQCPICGCKDISGDSVEIDTSVREACQEVTCQGCFSVWRDTYGLGYTQLLERGSDDEDSN
jgi:hypothetical protein